MALTQISTAGVKDDAVTAGKIPANAVGSSELADNAVDTNAIADDAVTADKLANSINTSISAKMPLTGGTFTGNLTSQKIVPVNDSQFDIGENATRFNNGYFDTLHGDGSNLTGITSTTINNNADNRVITGSGTANTLNGESTFVYNTSNNTVGIGTSSPEPTASYYQGACLHVHQAASGGSVGAQVHLTNDYGGSAAGDGSQVSHYNHSLYVNNQENGSTYFYNNGSATATITSAGNFGIGTQSPSQKLHVNGNIQASSIFLGGTGSANELSDYEEGTWTPTTANSGGGFQNMVSATYTKIGRLVNISVYAVFNNSQPNSNQIRIGGLPYQSISAIYHYAVGRLQGFAANDISWQVGGTSDYLTPYYNNTIPTYNQVAGYYFLISGSYITDS